MQNCDVRTARESPTQPVSVNMQSCMPGTAQPTGSQGRTMAAVDVAWLHMEQPTNLMMVSALSVIVPAKPMW